MERAFSADTSYQNNDGRAGRVARCGGGVYCEMMGGVCLARDALVAVGGWVGGAGQVW